MLIWNVTTSTYRRQARVALSPGTSDYLLIAVHNGLGAQYAPVGVSLRASGGLGRVEFTRSPLALLQLADPNVLWYVWPHGDVESGETTIVAPVTAIRFVVTVSALVDVLQ